MACRFEMRAICKWIERQMNNSLRRAAPAFDCNWGWNGQARDAPPCSLLTQSVSTRRYGLSAKSLAGIVALYVFAVIAAAGDHLPRVMFAVLNAAD